MTQTTEHSRPSTQDGFYETRAAAVYAYCWRLCSPDRITAAVEAAFANAANGDDETRDRKLRAAVRRAAAEHAPLAPPSGDYCRIAARLLASRADGALTGTDDATLRGHLAHCEGCRDLAARFDDAERALEALLPKGAAPPVVADTVVEPPVVPLSDAPVEAPGVAPLADTRVEPPAVPQPPERAPRAPTLDAAAPETLAPAPDPPPAPEPSEHAKERPRVPLPRVSPAVRRHLSTVLLVLGVLLIAEAITTVVWKEPFTAYLASRAQAALRGELARLDRSPGRLDTAAQRSLAALPDARRREARRLELLARSLAAHTREGSALGWIEIPRIGVDYVFVQGTDAASLRKGPAHYTETPLPGAPGTVGIAGHRTTYLAPFRDIDELKRGDRIVIRMPYGRFVYAVEGHRIVPAGVTNAFAPTGHAQLVLSACHPLYSASHRILVSARLVSVQPHGATSVDTRRARPGSGQVAAELAILGDRELALGKTGPDVRELQRLLGVPATGYFGYQTQSAVEDFARAHGLDASGVVDEPLKRALAERGPPSAPPTPPAVAPQQ